MSQYDLGQEDGLAVRRWYQTGRVQEADRFVKNVSKNSPEYNLGFLRGRGITPKVVSYSSAIGTVTATLAIGVVFGVALGIILRGMAENALDSGVVATRRVDRRGRLRDDA